MTFTQAEGTVAVGVDPYLRADRSQAVFGADLPAAAVVPLQVVIRNLGQRPVRIEVRNFRLSLPDQEVVGSRPAAEVAALLSRPSGAANQASTGIGVLGGLGGAIGGLAAKAVGGAVSETIQGSEQEAFAARRADYARKQLKDVVLGVGESTRGFLFFGLPDGTASLDEATLVLDLPDGGASVRVPLTGLGYRAGPEGDG
jgi:hypothetical protein